MLASTSPDLAYNAAGHPTKALFCESAAQSVTATLISTGSTAPATVAQPKAVLFYSQSVHQ